MTKTPKRPRDPNQLANFIVDVASGAIEDRAPTSEEQRKDPAAVARGKAGGEKGGRARSNNLSSDRRTEIARSAAAKRWEKH